MREKGRQMYLATLGVVVLLTGSCWGQLLTSCPSGWMSWQTFCYLFVNTTRVSWTQAGDECVGNRAELLRIETLDEYNFVKKGLIQYRSPAYWTSLNDNPLNPGSSVGQLFLWGTDEYTNDDVVKAHWDKEPTNSDLEDCVTVNIQGTLTVEDCNRRHGYVCEVNKNPGEACPQTWIYGTADTSCYLISNVSDWSQVRTWGDARKQCEINVVVSGKSRQGRLVSIDSPDDQNFIQTYLSTYALTRQTYWTGLNDIGLEGNFVWMGNNDHPLNNALVVWTQEPNNLAGMEHCGVILPGGSFADRDCNNYYNYACRMEIAQPGQVQTDLGCGVWLRAGRKCFYTYSKVKKNWQDARTYCQSMGGDLMKFDNLDDVNWLGIQSASNLMELPGYWIGLNDRQQENVFVWADGSPSQPELLNWDTEPNGHSLGVGVMDQDCAIMGIDGNFLDRACTQEKAGAICEIPSSNCDQSSWVIYSTNNHCYYFDKQYRTHDEAEGNCARISIDGQGHLFSLNTQDEKDFILSQLSSLPNGSPYYYWSDLTDEVMENDWHWANPNDDDPVSVDQLVTWSHEPNNYKKMEDCVEVYYGGYLNDVNCSIQTGFICQKNLNASFTTNG